MVDERRWLATQASVQTDDPEQRFRAAVEWDGHLLLVLEDGGELAGALGLQPTQADGVLTLGMWIVAGQRGRGGGRMLIESALEARPSTPTRSSSRSSPTVPLRSPCRSRSGSSGRACAGHRRARGQLAALGARR